MTGYIALVLTGALTHLSTNLDNLLILIALMPGLRVLRALLAWRLAQSAVLLGAMALAEGAEQAIGADIGWLGLVPVALGVVALRRRHAPESASLPRRASFAGAVLTFLSMSGDTLAVFAPLFADTREPLEPLILLGALASMAGMMALSRLSQHGGERLAPWTDRAERAMPFVMIGLGLYVLSNTLSD